MIMIYAFVGIRLYKDVTYESSNMILRRNKFTNFPRAVLSCFTIVAGETWAQVYYEFKKANNTSYTTVYFFSLYFLVSFILLNFLLSIILNTISEASKRIETKSKMNKLRNLKPSIDTIICNDYIDYFINNTKNIFNNKIVPMMMPSSSSSTGLSKTSTKEESELKK
jgi:Ion transport protein